MQFKSYVEFFERVGDNYLHPKYNAECIWPVTVEEMYQYFKERMIEELVVDSPDLIGYGLLKNNPIKNDATEA